MTDIRELQRIPETWWKTENLHIPEINGKYPKLEKFQLCLQTELVTSISSAVSKELLYI